MGFIRFARSWIPAVFPILVSVVPVSSGYGQESKGVEAQPAAPEQKRVEVAVLDFDALGISDMEAKVVTERLRAELARTEYYQVMRRRKMEAEEAGKQDPVKLGKELGVERLVIGSISKIGSTFSLVADLIDAQTGQTIKTVIEDHRGEIETLVSEGVGRVATRLSEYESGGYLAITGKRGRDTLEHLLMWIDGRQVKEFPKVDFILISDIPEGIYSIKMQWKRPGKDGTREPYSVEIHPGMVVTLEANAIVLRPTLRITEPVKWMDIQEWRDYDWRRIYPDKRYIGKELQYLSEFKLKDLWRQEQQGAVQK